MQISVTPRNSHISTSLAGLLLAGLCLLAGAPMVQAQTDWIKANNTTALTTSGSWVATGTPGTSDLLTWNNTVTGANTVLLGANDSVGAIQIVNPGGAVTISAGNTLTLGGSSLDTYAIDLGTASQNLTVSSGLTLSSLATANVAAGRTLTIGGTLTATSGFTKVGGGTLTINGVATTVNNVSTLSANGGITILSSGGGANVLNSSANLVVGGGAFYYQYNGAYNSAMNNLTINPGEATVYSSRNGSYNQSLTISGTVTRNIGGTVYSRVLDSSRGSTIYTSMTSLALVKDANGSAYMTTGNTYSGATSDDLNDWAAINSGHQVVIAGYTSTTATTLGTSAQNANVNVATTTLAANDTIASFRDADNIASTVDLHSYTLTTGGILVNSSITTAGSIIKDSVGGGAIVGPSATANCDIPIFVDANVTTPQPYTISATIANNGSSFSTAITKGAPGILILSGNNTFTGGLYINNGIVQLGSTGALNSTTPNAVYFDGSGEISGIENTTYGPVATAPTLALGGNSVAVASLSVANDLAGSTPLIEDLSSSSATLTVNGTSTFTGTILDGAGGGQLGVTMGGSSGTLTLGGTLSYSGATTVNSGGTLALNNAPSATAGYVVNGTLNATALGSSTLALGAQYLTGGGTVNGSVTTAAGSILSPGAGTSTTGGNGTLTVNNNLSLVGGSSVNFGLNASLPNNSQVAVTTGTFTLPASGKVTLNLYSPGTSTAFTAAGTYNLFAYPTGSGINVSSLASEFTIGTSIIGYVPSFSATVSGGTTYVTLTLAVSTSVIATWTDGNSGTDNNWSDAGNWSGGVPSLAGSSATLGNVVSPVVLDANQSVGSLTFNQSSSYTISGSSTLTLDNSGVGASVSVTAGTANQIQPPVNLNDGTTITVNSGTTLAISGAVANSSVPETLAVGGGGTLALTSANTYGPASGSSTGTSLSGGTLQVGNSGALGAGAVSVVGNSTLQAAPSTTLTVNNPVAITSGLTTTVDNNGNSFTLGGVISGGGSLAEIGSGSLTLTGANTYGGSTTLGNGVVSISADNNLGADPGSATPNNIVLNGGDLLGTATLTLPANRGIGIGAASGSATATGLVDVAASTILTLNGIIASAGNSGTDNLTVNGGVGSTGTVVLGGANTFNGATTLTAGALQLANSLALQDSTINYTNGLLQFGSGVTAATILQFYGTQNLSLNNQASTPAGVTLTTGGNNATWGYGGIFSGLGSLTKVGSGNLTLTNANTFSGGITVNGGTVTIGANGVFNGTYASPVAGNFVVNGGVVTSSVSSTIGSGSTSQYIQINSGTAVFNGGIVGAANDGQSVLVDGGTLNASSISFYRVAAYSTLPTVAVPQPANQNNGFYVNGSGTVANVGSLTLASGNSSGGGRIDGGTVTITNTLAIGDSVSGSRYEIMQVTGGSLTSLDSVNGIVVTENNGTTLNLGELYLDGGTTTANIINFGGTADTVNNTGWLFVAGGSLYLGSGGIVKRHAADAVNIVLTNGLLGATANWSSSLPMQLTGLPTSPFTIQTENSGGTTAYNITLTGALSGTGALTETGNGTLTLGGVNTYTGNTTVSSGTLAVTGSTAAGSAVTVASGATLTGTGTINGSLTLQSGALATLTAGSLLSVGGTGTVSGNMVTVNVPGAALTAGSYTLLTASSGLTGSVNTTPVYTGSGVASGFAGTLAVSGNSIVLTVAPVAMPNIWTDGDSTGNWSDVLNWSLGVAPQNPGDVAEFGTGVGPVTLDVPESVGFLIFNNATSYTISGANTLTLDDSGSGSYVSVTAGTANTVATPVSLNDNASISVGSGDSLTLSGAISSTSTARTLTLAGPGTNILSAANSYGPTAGTVGTTVNSGVVQVGNNSALSTGDVAVNGGSTLQAGTAGLSVANNFITSSGVTFTANNNGNTFTLAGLISGAGGVQSIGSGTTILSDNNTYTGLTTANTGTLILSGSNTGATGATVVTNGATLRLANANAVNGKLILATGTTVQLRSDTTTSFAPSSIAVQTNISETFNFDVGPITTGVTGNTLTLADTINNGTNDNMTINVTGNSTYGLVLGNFVSGNTGHNPYTETLFNTTASGPALTIGQILTGNWSQWLNFQGGGNVTMSGSLTNVSNGTATIYVSGGTSLTMQGRSSLWASATGTTDGFRYDVANGTLVLDNNYALTNNTTGAAAVPAYFILGAATNLYYSATITPPAGLLVNTNNGFNASVYLGDATHATGGLSVGATVTNWVSDGDANFANSGVMTIGGQNTSGINTYNNPIVLGWTANHGKSANLVAATGGEVDFAGPIRANGSDTTAGVTVGSSTFGGTVKLLAVNTYAGPTTISYGTLALGASGALFANSSVSIAAGATFDVSAQSAYTLGTSASLTASGNASAATINGASGGTVSLGSRPVTLNFDGTHAPLTLSQGTLALSGNTFTVAVSGAALNTGTYTLVNAPAVTGTVNTTPVITGSGLAANTLATVGINGGLVQLVVANSVNTGRTNIISSVSGNVLTLSWPTDHTGWRLLVQTNNLALGISANTNDWTTVSGSSSTNLENLPINPLLPTEFYELIYP